ncbi:hypothetical protein [Portibacter marinus]|uniref:hypothetical protein n=1 Tax=Portibacter marinus TaxID=2898660 RepID=UPI001F369E60|nr:hypothetical protein [Portibacter marinus]
MSTLKAAIQNDLYQGIIYDNLVENLQKLGYKFRKSKCDFIIKKGDMQINVMLFKPYNFITFNRESKCVELRIQMVIKGFNKKYHEYLRSIHNRENVKSKLQLDMKNLIFQLSTAQFYQKITGKEAKTQFDADYFVNEGGATQSPPNNETDKLYLNEIKTSNFQYFNSLLSKYDSIENVFINTPNKLHQNMYSILGYIGDQETLKDYLDNHYDNLRRYFLVENNDRYEEYLKDFIPFAKKIANVEYLMPIK